MSTYSHIDCDLTLKRLLYSPRDAGFLLSISHASIYRLLADGRLKAVKIGGRTGITAESIRLLAAGESK